MQRETDLGQYIGKEGSDTRDLERWEDSVYQLVGFVLCWAGARKGDSGFSEQPGWIPRCTRLGSLRKVAALETSECTYLGTVQSSGWCCTWLHSV